MRKIMLLAAALLLCCIYTIGISDDSIEIARPISGSFDTVEVSIPNTPRTSDISILLDVPENDNCSDAESIGEVVSMSFDVTEATIDGGYLSGTYNVWYKYTSTITGPVRIASDDNLAAGELVVYDAATCPEYTNFPHAEMLSGGETIESAVAIDDPLPVTISGSLTGYSRDYASLCIAGERTIPDVVYSYTSDVNDSITILLESPEENVGAFLMILDEDGNELVCSYADYYMFYEDDERVSGRRIVDFPVMAGEAYYIVVSTEWVDTYEDVDYILRVYSPSYTTIGRNLSLNRHSEVVFDAISGQEYLIEVGYYGNESCTTSVLSIDSAPAPPPNDDCENATDGGILSPGSTIQFTGDNTGVTRGCDLFGVALGEVWIKFTIEDTMNIWMDFCGTETITGDFQWSLIMSDGCPYDSRSWHFGASDNNVFVIRCPNLSTILRWWNLSPGTYWYPMLVQYDFQGPYTINIGGFVEQECNDESLFGHGPLPSDQYGWDFWLSDIEAGYAVADKFEDLNAPIYEVTWWGNSANPENTEEICELEDSGSFQIIFCEYDEYNPLLPGDTIAIYNDLVPTVEETGELYCYMGNTMIYQKKFMVTLPEQVEISDGWIFIRGNDGINDCAFIWQNSDVIGSGVVYDVIEDTWTRTYNSFAFCLSGERVSVDDSPIEIPSSFELSQNYPNPFNAHTSIQFSLAKEDNVTLSIYDIGGRLIKSLYDGMLMAGMHDIIWDGTNNNGQSVSSGIYFYRLQYSEGSCSKSMVFLK